jgi:hypothetical protein
VDATGASDESAGSRTAKSCGPDASTLASSFAEVFAKRRWQESPITGESTKETVKTIACGNAGCSGVPRGDYARVLSIFAREAAGATGTRHSPLPRFRGPKGFIKARARSAPRGRGIALGCLTFESVTIMTSHRHSGAAPTGRRSAPPDDRLRAEPGIHNHDREYGFSDVQLHIVVRCFASPRNDGLIASRSLSSGAHTHRR